jgi:CDP-diglyceride synthetase
MRRALQWASLALASGLLSFPIGGAVGNLAQNPISEMIKNPAGDIIVLLLGAVVATDTGGYTYGKTWEKVSLYPWIIATGVVLFLSGAFLFGLIKPRSRN